MHTHVLSNVVDYMTTIRCCAPLEPGHARPLPSTTAAARRPRGTGGTAVCGDLPTHQVPWETMLVAVPPRRAPCADAIAGRPGEGLEGEVNACA
jgi:hypothetical protein